jgi:cell wall-associated NlpC family hydrolase
MIEFVEEARKYIGSPFHHQGRVKAGIDCIGLIVNAARATGRKIVDNTNYPRTPDPAQLLKYIQLNFDQLDVPEEGCIVLFWIRSSKKPQHAAILTETGGILHTWYDVGKVVETPFDDRWTKRIHSYWKLR